VNISCVVKCLDNIPNSGRDALQVPFKCFGPFEFIATPIKLKLALKNFMDQVYNIPTEQFSSTKIKHVDTVGALSLHAPDLLWSITFHYGILDESKLESILSM